MKLSKLFHTLSALSGIAGVITFIIISFWSPSGPSELVFGVTKIHALLCVVILLLGAIWLQIATIHHMMLEKNGEII